MVSGGLRVAALMVGVEESREFGRRVPRSHVRGHQAALAFFPACRWSFPIYPETSLNGTKEPQNVVSNIVRSGNDVLAFAR